MHSSPLLTRCVVLSLMLLCATVAAQSPTQPQPTGPAEFGKLFPAGIYKNLNLKAGPNTIDLSATVGRKPVILVYWIPGNPRADEVFKDVQAVVDEVGSDKVALYGVVLTQPNRGREAVENRVTALGIKVPVLDDEGFKIGQQLRVQSVPNITMLDSHGRLQLTNGASLYQILEYKMSIDTAIRRAAETGKLGRYGYLARYYPVNELVGKQCPDFKAPLLTTSVEKRWSSLLDSEKLNVLVFWSVDCPHCRESLPEFSAWLRANSEGLNVVTVAKSNSDATKAKTLEFCELNDFVFPTLLDKNEEVSRLYRVTSTPTFVIIGPDGVVDSVMLHGSGSLQRTLQEKKKQLL